MEKAPTQGRIPTREPLIDTPGSESPRHDPYAALRLGDYRRFLLGGILASAGAEMQGVAVGWELYERTGSATALGLVGLAMVLPVLLLAIPAGHAADRYSRKPQCSPRRRCWPWPRSAWRPSRSRGGRSAWSTSPWRWPGSARR